MLWEEDIGNTGDITSDLIIDSKSKGSFRIINREKKIVVAGVELAVELLKYLDNDIKIHNKKHDGSKLGHEAVVLAGLGNIKTILKSERTILNFIQHMSGIATLTNQYVNKVSPLWS